MLLGGRPAALGGRRLGRGRSYVTGVLCVGLTGILGAGKSTVGRVLAGLGAVVIDADQVEREVLAPGTAGEREVLEHFAGAGQAVARPDGTLDRGALARVVFSDPELRKALEAISHPLIEESVSARVARVAAELPTAVVVIELPLLDADRRLRYHLDFVVLVDAPEEVAVGRGSAPARHVRAGRTCPSGGAAEPGGAPGRCGQGVHEHR